MTQATHSPVAPMVYGYGDSTTYTLRDGIECLVRQRHRNGVLEYATIETSEFWGGNGSRKAAQHRYREKLSALAAPRTFIKGKLFVPKPGGWRYLVVTIRPVRTEGQQP